VAISIIIEGRIGPNQSYGLEQNAPSKEVGKEMVDQWRKEGGFWYEDAYYPWSTVTRAEVVQYDPNTGRRY
jgi:hypothetical protein